MTKQEKKQKKITTQNRKVTINKRETSFDGLVTKFENGENGVYNLIIENDKNIIFTPKISITQEDIAVVPGLKALRDAIAAVQAEQKVARGKRKYLLTKQLIQMRQDQYVLKNSYYKPISCLSAIKNFHVINFEEKVTIAEDGSISSNGLVTFFNPKHISALLCNYSKLKEACYGKFYTDGYYVIKDLQNLVDNALKEQHPFYYKLLIYKIDGKQNVEIQKLLNDEFGIRHSVQYLSALWRKKIPKLIAEEAEKEYLLWYYTNKEYGNWKKCSRCGEVKLAHQKFYSRNSSSRDGFYSICKTCRNTRKPPKKKPSNLIIKRVPYDRTKQQNCNYTIFEQKKGD